ncbi:MAG TPA: hypothetical protein VMZ28_02635 [Kofleriaceae bacterium]|nr:hypothetical protein [Kofleriaceae bacterium]
MEQGSLIARLLSGRDRLGRVEKDAMLERVLSDTASPARAPRRVAALLLVGVAAAAGVFLFVRGGASERPEGSRFASRGAAAETAALRLSCRGGDTCAAGDELLLDLQGTRGYRYLAVFAQRADGAVVWYLPEADGGTSIDLAEHLRRGVLDRKVMLAADEPRGRQTLHAIYSTGPLTREAIRTRFQPGKRDLGPHTAVVSKELVLR